MVVDLTLPKKAEEKFRLMAEAQGLHKKVKKLGVDFSHGDSLKIYLRPLGGDGG